MEYQASQINYPSKPPQHLLNEWLNKTHTMYGTVRVPVHYTKPFNLEECRGIVRLLLSHVKSDSTPGIPYASCFATNKQLLQMCADEIVDITVNRISKLVGLPSPPSSAWFDPVDSITLGYVDPVRTFIKKEPHKSSKIAQKRFRIISCISLVDQLVERYTSWFINYDEIGNYQSIPSQPGMGFCDEPSSLLYQQIIEESSRKTMAAVDVSGWDWSCPGWLLEQAGELKIMRTPNAASWYHNLLRNRCRLASRSVFCLSNGVLYSQIVSGIMKSGRYETSSDNSRMRALTTVAVGSDFCKTMGDDSLERYVQDAPAIYKKLFGMVVKDYVPITDTFEFCGHIYGPGYVKPVSWVKTFMNYVHNETSDEAEQHMFACQLVDNFKDDPETLNHMLELLRCVGWDAQSVLSEYATNRQKANNNHPTTTTTTSP